MLFKLTIILFVLYRTDAGCPSMCNCSTNTVLCANKKLSYTPNFDSLSIKPKIIDLSGNYLNEITAWSFSFDYSIYVKELYLNSSEVIVINEKSFDELQHLQTLHLSDNLLNNISENLIVNLEEITVLDLSNNQFNDFPKLLSKYLEVLGLANSKITNVPLDSLNGLPNLKVLFLEQNNIKYISPNVINSAYQLTYIDLLMNPWPCNCGTKKLFEFLAHKQLISDNEPLKCLNDQNEYVVNDLPENCTDIIEENMIVFEENEFMDDYLDDEEILPYDEELLVQEIVKNDTNASLSLEIAPQYINEVEKNDSNYSLLKLENKTSIPEDDGNVIYVKLAENGVTVYSVIFFFGSFTIGLIVGVFLTYVKMQNRIRKSKKHTESTTLLITQ